MTSDVHIRPYADADCEALIDLFRQSVRFVACRDYSSEQVAAWAPDDISAIAFGLARSQVWTMVGIIDGEIAGFSDLDARGHINMLYAHPAYQRQGVARALLATIETMAQQQNIPHLWTEASITAKPVFERFGFTVIATQTVTRRGQNFTNYKMHKHLKY